MNPKVLNDLLTKLNSLINLSKPLDSELGYRHNVILGKDLT